MFHPARSARRRPVAAVLALTALALLLRLIALGDRTMHWDEARVAYWTLRYVRGAGLVYRPVIHGPLVPILVAPLFEHLGPTAFAARLPVAIIGGLAPLAALLFRRPAASTGAAEDCVDGVEGDRVNGAESDRIASTNDSNDTGADASDHGDGAGFPELGLSNLETATLALLLAVTPSFVYYSRFMRSDVPLAVFSLFAVGFGIRALMTGRRRHVVAAGLFVGLAVPTKENVLLYGACAVGAAAVAVCWPAVSAWLWGGDDQPLEQQRDHPREHRHDPRTAASEALRDSLALARAALARHLPVAPLALLVALVPVVFFLAPRGPAGDPALGAALAGEASWVALVERATVGTWETFMASFWTETRSHSYPEYAGKLAGYLLVGALPVVVGAGYAFVRAVRGISRPLVVPLVAWGVAALLGYPLATDIPAPWISVHILLPLFVPAAVGLVALAREQPWAPLGVTDRDARDRYARDSGIHARYVPDNEARSRYARYALAALVVLSAVQVPFVLAVSSVTPPLFVNVLAQTAQPPDDLSPMRETVDDAAGEGGVLYYGETYSLPPESDADDPPAAGENWLGWWLGRLPMAWYVERANASASAAVDVETLRGMETIPPVVFADPADASEAAPILEERGYERTRYDLGLYHEQAVVLFVDENRVDGPGEADRTAR